MATKSQATFFSLITAALALAIGRHLDAGDVEAAKLVFTAEMMEPASTRMPASRALAGSAPSARPRASTTRTSTPASFSTSAVW